PRGGGGRARRQLRAGRAVPRRRAGGRRRAGRPGGPLPGAGGGPARGPGRHRGLGGAARGPGVVRACPRRGRPPSDPRPGGPAARRPVPEGAEEAITAALGGAADAVAVAGLDAAVAILHGLKGAGAGTAGLVIAAASPGPARPGTRPVRAPAGLAEGLPPGVIPALDLVKAPGELSPAVARPPPRGVLARPLPPPPPPVPPPPPPPP